VPLSCSGRKGTESLKVKDTYPMFFNVSCKACKLECNVCYNCELDTFLDCDLVPEGCALKHNIRRYHHNESYSDS